MLIDTHSHIYSQEFRKDRNEVIQRALSNNVNKILLPNIDSSSIKPMLDLTNSYPDICFPTIGLHPTSVKEDYRQELEIMLYWIEKRKFYAIGEIGIDLYWDKTFIKEQTDSFRIQLKWAKEMKLPVIIHVRESFQEVASIVKEELDSNLSGVFHSFIGTPDEAKQIIDWGFKIGVNGIVTFKNSGLDKTIATLSPQNLLLETDAPYLAPTPFRGKRNESAYINRVSDKLAQIFNLPTEEICRITTKNAVDLFRI